MNFRVNLDIFRGPMDLLLYLVRRHELDILEIPVSLVTDQYLAHLEILQALNVDDVGEFLVVASTLMELKSRMLLPRTEDENPEIEPFEELRQELVSRLLEYKQFKEAASILEERGKNWQDRFARMAPEEASPSESAPSEPAHIEVELWDLVSAFGRILKEHAAETKPSNIVYDDTPIHVYMKMIHSRLKEKGRLPFSELFRAHMHKSMLIGIFLAVLELVRHHGVKTEQEDLFGEIWIVQGEIKEARIDASQVDNYEPSKPSHLEPPGP